MAGDPSTPETRALKEAGERRKAELIELAGGLYTRQETSSLLNMSGPQIEERHKAGTIIAVRAGEDLGYPACQFGLDEMVPGLPDALAVMPIRADWMRLEWLLVSDDALGGLSPLEALRIGRFEDVIDVARAQGAE
jgi:hypothetical protein